MSRLLEDMRQSAQLYVDILSEILQLDVTIITSSQVRIAGSGCVKDRLGDMSSYGYVVEEAIRSGKLTVMDDPNSSPICQKCPNLASCDNVCEVWLPLRMDDVTLGVLGFVCFDLTQKEKFLNNYETYIRFLEEFGDLLISKAKDVQREKQSHTVIALLESTLNRIDSGILVMDQDLNISRINLAGKKLLCLKELSEIPSRISFQETGRKVGSLAEYRLKIRDVEFLLMGQLFDLEMEEYQKLFVFQKAALSGGELPAPKKFRELDRIQGKSPQILAVKEKIQVVARSSSSVLITGNSGTGKELVAVALHGESERSNYPFLAVNCASIPENLLESELFGYVKGAFTGADSRGRPGLFEAANGGTVFLDEIDDMPLHLQAKLLRVLENRRVTRLGSNVPIDINVRIVSATNQKLEDLVAQRNFREDLYYRLNVIPIALPALQERQGDVRLIAASFIERYSAVLNKDVRGVEEEFWSCLDRYDWPGNVRELQNTIEYVMNMLPYGGILSTSLLPTKFFNQEVPADPLRAELLKEDLSLERMEKKLIQRALTIYGSSTKAKNIIAEEMGIGVATLYRKIKQYQL